MLSKRGIRTHAAEDNSMASSRDPGALSGILASISFVGTEGLGHCRLSRLSLIPSATEPSFCTN